MYKKSKISLIFFKPHTVLLVNLNLSDLDDNICYLFEDKIIIQ